MGSIMIRGLDESVMHELSVRAQEHGRSVQAEVHEILMCAVQRPHVGMALMLAVQGFGGVQDLQMPARCRDVKGVEFD